MNRKRMIVMGMVAAMVAGLQLIGQIPRVWAEPGSAKHLAAASETEVVYVGSEKAKIFHLPTCRFADRIQEDQLVTFESAKDAEAAGRRPCKICLKPSKTGT